MVQENFFSPYLTEEYPKMLMKDEMSLDMLADRIMVLEDVVNLMCAADRFLLDISISEHIYRLYSDKGIKGGCA